MSNQEILDNAPEGATHIDNNGFYLRAGKSGFMEPSDCGLGWDYDYANHTEVRSLADIKLIAELDKERDIRDLEQQAKGLENYVSKCMGNCYILHLDPENTHQAFLINLNATALRLRNQAKALKEGE